ncbi:MAG TPA: DUF4349 domain-containing protein [Nanoarchaeota archaeon]|nr:DUF4349 domain-containing protein [Nanoarchaeota archaeon]
MGLKEWIKTHWIWSIILGIILVYIVVSFAPSMYSPVEETDGFAKSSIGYGGGMPEPLYDSGYESEAPAPARAIVGEGADGAEQNAVAERKITKTASIDTEVDTGKFKETESKAKDDISSLDAFILNEDVQLHKSGDAGYYTGSYTIKVESGKYDSLVAKLKEIPKLQSFSESADDITDQYTDLDVELKAEKERLERYRALYAEINDTEDKIDLSDRMFYQERTIEYMEKALKEAGKKVDYYTIGFYLSEKEPSFFNVEFVGASELAANILNGTSALLRLASYLLPFLVVGFGIWGIRRYFKNRKSLEKPVFRKKQ